MSANSIKTNIGKLISALTELENSCDVMVRQLQEVSRYHLPTLYPHISSFKSKMRKAKSIHQVTFNDVSSGLETYLRWYINEMDNFSSNYSDEKINSLSSTIRKMIPIAEYDLKNGGICTYESGFSEKPIEKFIPYFQSLKGVCQKFSGTSRRASDKVIIKR